MSWRALAVLPALAFGAFAPSAAVAVTFGSSLPAPSAGFHDSCVEACTAAPVGIPGAQTRSPADGTIVRFRLRTGAGSDAQNVKFRVLRSSDGVNFTGAGTSAAFDLPQTAGITEFPVSMPVRVGDYIGIDQPGGNKRAMTISQDADAFPRPARRSGSRRTAPPPGRSRPAPTRAGRRCAARRPPRSRSAASRSASRWPAPARAPRSRSATCPATTSWPAAASGSTSRSASSRP